MEQVQNTPQVHTAFNPVIIIGSPSTGETGDGELTITVNGEETVKSKEYFNGQAVFDLSSILQKKFVNQVTEVDALLNSESINKMYIDKSLFVKYSTLANAPDSGWDDEERCAINAVAQIGESSNKITLIGKILNKFSVLKLYDGYPQNVYGLTSFNEDFNSEFKFITFDTSTKATTTSRISIISSPLIFDDDPFIPERVEFWDNGIKSDERKVIRITDFCQIGTGINEAIPNHPFYIRWINGSAGRDHWMFTKRNEQKKSEITESFKPYIHDQEAAGTFEHVIAGNGSKAIVAGSGHITREDYEVLSDIVFSPKIEWYNETLQKWIQVKLDNPTIEKDYDAERADIELTFILPEIQMQY